MKLRDYQYMAVCDTIDALETNQSALMVMATGCGKTVCYGHIVADYVHRGRVMILTHREELCDQGANKIERICGAKCEAEIGNRWAMESLIKAPVVVSTVQTQVAGFKGKGRMSRFRPEEFSLIVIDEAHHAPATTYRKTVNYYVERNPAIRIVGVTATPDRHDKKAMGQVFDVVSFEYSMLDAIEDGWLVDVNQRLISYVELDFSRCKVTAGDLNKGDVARIMEEERPLHEIARSTLDECDGLMTLVFAASVAHAEGLCKIFNRYKSDVARLVTDETKKDERRTIFADYAERKFDILLNVGICTEGFDIPGIEAVVIARPTMSRALYCLDEKTEVLTPGGWKGIDDPFDTAYEYSAQTSCIHISPVMARTKREQFPGEAMYGIEGRHLDICVTEKHRMLVRVRKGRAKIKSLDVVLANEMPDCEIPVAGFEHVHGIELSDDEIRFVGLVMTDGNLNEKNNQITLYQSDRHPECVVYFRRVIDACGFKFGHRIETGATNFGDRKHPVHCWTISKGLPRGRDSHLSGWGRLDGYIDKCLSSKLDTMTREQLLVLLEAMNVGDGAKHKCPSITWKPRTMAICSSRKLLMDRLQSLCVRRGIRCNLGDNGLGVSMAYVDPTRTWMSIPVSSKDRKVWGKQNRTSMVWCIQVNSGFIICRRNGKVFVSGNSQMCGRGTRPVDGLVDQFDTREKRREAIRNSAKPSIKIVDFIVENGNHKLIHTADILGGKYSELVLKEAEETIRASGKEASIIDELRKAEAKIQERERLAREAREARLRAGIVASASYSTEAIDPFAGLRHNSQDGVTDRQKWKLRQLGVRDVNHLSKRQASAIIGKLLAKQKAFAAKQMEIAI